MFLQQHANSAFISLLKSGILLPQQGRYLRYRRIHFKSMQQHDLSIRNPRKVKALLVMFVPLSSFNSEEIDVKEDRKYEENELL
jgi:hypothetical protein